VNRRGTRVLIVDDSLTVRMDLDEAFTGDGFATLLCADGAQARAAFRSGQFDVAVLDVLLPDADGVQLLKELRADPRRQDTVVVLLSSEAEVVDRVRGLDTGADEYVGKPYDLAYLLARVRQLLAERDTARGGTAADRSSTVLVVDDSPTFRHRLCDELTEEGYTVLAAETGEEGLRLAADRRPAAVVVDGVLPGIDGATVIRRIRLDAALRDTPCLLLTAADDYATEPQMLEAGADAFARKQQDLAVVKAKLAAILRHTADALPVDVTGSVHGPRKVLTVSPDPTRLVELTEQARDEGYDVVPAGSVEDALALLAAQPVDCIVLCADEGDSVPTCRRLKAVPELAEIPLVMTGGGEDALLTCLGAGADDYVRGSEGGATLRAHVRAQIRRKQQQDESRRIREELLRHELAAAEERAARQLAETRAALVEQLEWRNEELEAFSGSVSHDLRGPLQIVTGFAEELLEDDEHALSPVARQNVERIRAAADRMADLVESLLRLARASRGDLRRERFDLTTTAWQVVKEVGARNGDRPVQCAVHAGMVADGDQTLVRVVLENLVNNAWKFTARTGQPAIEIGWTGPGPDSRYFVRDNGAGFPAGKVAELFRPFARLHSAAEFPGTGIGLTTVSRIVERHGGRIWAEGEAGQGATFWFTLPPEP
jgi:DNA-binding response OmpR family regulator